MSVKMKALSIRQPWAWLIANGYKDIENRTWDTQFRGRFLIHAAKKFDKDGYAWVRNNFPDISMPTEFARSAIVGVGNLTECVIVHRSRWFFGPYGFVVSGATPTEPIEFPGRLGFFKPLGDYSVRSCRGHWHVIGGAGELEYDLSLPGDPYDTISAALRAAFDHKREVDEDREDFRQSQIISARATRKSVESYRK